MTKRRLLRWACGLLLTAAWASTGQGQIELRFSDPGVQDTTVTNASKANFNSLTPGVTYSTISMAAGVSGPSGTFTPSSPAANWVRGANDFGGAGGSGNYLLSGSVVGLTTPTSHALTLSADAGYFGVWVSSMDAFNQIRFLNNGTVVGIFSASSILGIGSPLIPPDPNPDLGTGHYGNPNNGRNIREPFVYLNFYAQNAASQFDAVEFIQLGNNGGFEIDNVAVLTELILAGDRGNDENVVGLLPVPEPLGLIAVGAALLVAARRRIGRPRHASERKA